MDSTIQAPPNRYFIKADCKYPIIPCRLWQVESGRQKAEISPIPIVDMKTSSGLRSDPQFQEVLKDPAVVEAELYLIVL